MKKKLKVWLFRKIEKRTHGDYSLHVKKPSTYCGCNDPECCLQDTDPMYNFCPKNFEKITGFKMKGGEFCQVEIHVKRVPKKRRKTPR